MSAFGNWWHGRRRGAVVIGLAAVVLLPTACTSAGTTAAAVPLALPAPTSGAVTFYLALPSSASNLVQAATAAATPGLPTYRHFSTLAGAAAKYGATDAQINSVASSIETLGLQFEADPTRLFGRVTGTTTQWQTALGTALSVQAATASSPFTTYSLPQQLPAALQPSGTSLVTTQAEVYVSTADGHRSAGGTQPGNAAGAASSAPGGQPWPVNTGTPLTANCTAPVLQQAEVYTPQQVQTAYGVDALRSTSSGTPVITVIDLGGGWQSGDLQQAATCFGYTAPGVTQAQGDGVVTAISNAGAETSLDVQTVSAVAPGAQLRLVQTNEAGLLDGFSRAVGDSKGLPDVISLSYGGCALSENQGAPGYVAVIDSILAMASLTGVSTFVAAGDSGSTTCGADLARTTLSYPAVSPFVTAVGGTRLALAAGNARASETVWNDTVYGESAAGGGAYSQLESRPFYQNGVSAQSTRAVPDVSALADIAPGWPVVVNGTLETVGGTSGSTPLTAAATALVAATEQKAGRSSIGLANGWFYQSASQNPSTFYDVTQGSNDLAGVGCCLAAVGYDAASGLGVPNWATLPAALPKAG
jgi:subtilase family serine protease